MAITRRSSGELGPEELASLREMVRAVWAQEAEAFTDEDWGHAVGGMHFVLEDRGVTIAHASVVERELHTSGHRLATGYVEAAAVKVTHQRRGHGTALMREVDDYIDRMFPLGALNTGVPVFYERLGWVVWKGPTFVRTEAGWQRTPQEDGNVMVRATPTSPQLDLASPISCDWREGDVW